MSWFIFVLPHHSFTILLDDLFSTNQFQIFVVRYDHDKQPNLVSHTDSSDVSFNILLNDEFEGGGTRKCSESAPFTSNDSCMHAPNL